MNTNSYQKLNFKREGPSEYRHRLRAFAIANRIQRPSNYYFVAEEIVAQDMVEQFIKFDLTTSNIRA